jgi:hypothetical protein
MRLGWNVVFDLEITRCAPRAGSSARSRITMSMLQQQLQRALLTTVDLFVRDDFR